MTVKPFIAAAVQAAPAFLELERSVDKTIGLIEQAAHAGAKLIAFPELWLPGYPWWIWLGSPAWATQRGFAMTYRREAFTYESVHAQRLSEAARQCGMVVSIGVAERDGGSLYIGQWLIDSDGTTLCRRRKLKPGAAERVLFGEGDGTHLSVAQTALGRVGALCCGEHRQPLFKYALHAQHEDVHIAAWPSFSLYQPMAPGLGANVNNALSQVYAAEGGCYVLAPCAVVTPAMVEMLCDTPERLTLLSAGGGHAQAFSPHGEALCAPLAPDAEGLLFVNIEPAHIDAARASYDVSGHSARHDVVTLDIRTRAAARPASLAEPEQAADQILPQCPPK